MLLRSSTKDLGSIYILIVSIFLNNICKNSNKCYRAIEDFYEFWDIEREIKSSIISLMVSLKG